MATRTFTIVSITAAIALAVFGGFFFYYRAQINTSGTCSSIEALFACQNFMMYAALTCFFSAFLVVFAWLILRSRQPDKTKKVDIYFVVLSSFLIVVGVISSILSFVAYYYFRTANCTDSLNQSVGQSILALGISSIIGTMIYFLFLIWAYRGRTKDIGEALVGDGTFNVRDWTSTYPTEKKVTFEPSRKYMYPEKSKYTSPPPPTYRDDTVKTLEKSYKRAKDYAKLLKKENEALKRQQILSSQIAEVPKVAEIEEKESLA